MKITSEEVERVAQLARLTLTKEEVDKMTRQLDTILSYAAKLDELDTHGVPPTSHSRSATNTFREDIVQESLPREKVLQGGPLHNDESFIVPRIIG